MEEILAQLGGHSELFIYFAIFAVLILCGVGIPLPEDIPLITAGFLAYGGTINVWVAIGVCMVAVLGGDSIIYYIGRRWGLSILKHRWFAKLMHEERLGKVREYFDRYGDRTIFFARFIVGFRAVTFWAAGTLHVPYWKFLLFDGIAALLSVPAFVLLGWYFGDNIEYALGLLGSVERVILAVAVVGLLLLAYAEFKRRRKKRAAATSERSEIDGQE